jgi:hypothetical protein
MLGRFSSRAMALSNVRRPRRTFSVRGARSTLGEVTLDSASCLSSAIFHSFALSRSFTPQSAPNGKDGRNAFGLVR